MSPFLFLLVAVQACSAGLAAAASGPGADALLERAAAQRLHEDPYWWTLLHYRRTLCGVRSLVDDPRFFLAQDGKSNPESELHATLRALFEPGGEGSEELACRFVARHAWLRERLGAGELGIPETSCRSFQETMDRIRPRSVTLTFPTSYINSPASMFGHTLLRIDSDSESRLMSQAVNYAATGLDTNGLLFAFKGIFGLYKGYFSILPYYERVEQYNDIDQRDIWEYPLNLTPEEVMRMLRHLWELQSIYSDYYFFDENCSYTLLFLLDAARPSLKLTDSFDLWVMPLDTIREVRSTGLIEGAAYRPSRAARIRYLIGPLDEDDRRLALSIARGEAEPEAVSQALVPAPQTRLRMLDLAAEYVQHRYSEEELSREAYVQLFLGILRARSALGTPGEIESEVPAPVEPTLGHPSNKLGIAVGTRDFEGRQLFQEVRYRPAYHDLTDPDEGYIEGSQIEFFDVTVRYYDRRSQLKLQRLDIVNIVSLAPRDRFFKPISWEVETGLTRETTPKGEEALLYQLNAGGGLTYRNRFAGLVSLLLETHVRAGEKLEDHYGLGIGGSAGLLRSVGRLWKVQLYGRPVYNGLAESYLRVDFGCRQRFRLGAASALGLDFLGRMVEGDLETEIKLGWSVFF
ncbi:MAG: DUF4105 domain-containing protein [bacterium]